MSTKSKMSKEVYDAVLLIAGAVGISMTSKKILKEPLGAGYQFKMFDKNGYAEEAKIHNMAMEALTAEREKYLEEYRRANEKMDSTKSEISMEELLALGSYFSGNIPEDSAEFEQEVMDFIEDPQHIRSRTDENYIVTRPRKKFVSSATQKKRGTAPQWKYSERQREAAELIALAHDRLRGTPGVPEFSGGTAKTDSEIIQRAVEKIKAERSPVVPKKRGRPPKAKVEGEPNIPKKRGRPPKAKVEREPRIPKKRGRPPKAETITKRQ
ncbi:transcriptional regulator [Paramuricea clavata]|uniref:Transcriptional regulator n=1 Tax=Paramuricea clavata TaxID=317549 RepID=A0A7D9I4T0_PARCT|nr:transcriptional regulator [Paramuricea clavata]